jgi:hypothetical protein
MAIFKLIYKKKKQGIPKKKKKKKKKKPNKQKNPIKVPLVESPCLTSRCTT